jgi:hypothetical protein
LRARQRSHDLIDEHRLHRKLASVEAQAAVTHQVESVNASMCIAVRRAQDDA